MAPSRETPISRYRRVLLLVVVALIVVAADQYAKHVVSTRIPMHGGFEVIPGYFSLVHTRNPGAAFGIMAESGSRFRSVFFVLVSIAALVIILWTAIVAKDTGLFILPACGFFFGGAVGNLVDRLRFGEVVDFLDFHFGALHWPAFNVADSALCIGTGLFFLHFLMGTHRSGKQP